MATYPTNIVKPNRPSNRSTYNPIIKTESEANYPKVRRRTTKTRKKFNLTYTNMPIADFDILLSFFEANQGTIFTFTDPFTSTNYNCVFMQDELVDDYPHNLTTKVNTKVRLEEV